LKLKTGTFLKKKKKLPKEKEIDAVLGDGGAVGKEV
jgi:hypothetical protein